MISGSRNGVVAVDTAATTYTVSLSGSKLNLPVSGPMAGFGPGRLTAEDTENLRPGTLPNLDETVLPRN